MHFSYSNPLECIAVKTQASSLALDRAKFPRRTRKSKKLPAKPLQKIEDLAHTVDERFVLTFPPAAPQAPQVKVGEISIGNLVKAIENVIRK